MTTVTYGKIHSIDEALRAWWDVKGLSWALLQQIAAVIAATGEAGAAMNQLSQKLVADYAVKDEAGKPLRLKENGADTPFWNFGDNKAAADAAWEEIRALEFQCPTLSAALLQGDAEKLGLTPGMIAQLRPIIAPE